MAGPIGPDANLGQPAAPVDQVEDLPKERPAVPKGTDRAIAGRSDGSSPGGPGTWGVGHGEPGWRW